MQFWSRVPPVLFLGDDVGEDDDVDHGDGDDVDDAGDDDDVDDFGEDGDVDYDADDDDVDHDGCDLNFVCNSGQESALSLALPEQTNSTTNFDDCRSYLPILDFITIPPLISFIEDENVM